MLNPDGYGEDCSTLFTAWKNDFWSTGAYLVNTNGIRRIVSTVIDSGGRYRIPRATVADHMLFQLGKTYTLMRPIFSTIPSTSLMQDNASDMQMKTGESLLKRKKCLFDDVTRRNPSIDAIVTIGAAKDRENQHKNLRLVSRHLRQRVVYAIACVDNSAEAWEDMRTFAAKTLSVPMLIFDFNVNYAFLSKFIIQSRVHRAISMRFVLNSLLLMDADIYFDDAVHFQTF